MNQELLGYLFNTKAIRVCPENKPFWYTSGRIGPYYINTHFLYGSEEKANKLLKAIDELKEDKLSCSEEIYRLTKDNYLENNIFRDTIDTLVAYIKEHIDTNEIRYISGGERRDWFFSFMVAELLEKPHITLFKDNTAVVYHNGESEYSKDLNGAAVLHIADLITTASSYDRAWAPAINAINGSIKWSLVVVDRLQGGKEVLKRLGIESHALVEINSKVFESARDNRYIDDAQLDLVIRYINDPESSMKEFLMNNPDFLAESQKADERTSNRARLLIENDFYKIGDGSVS